MTVIEAVAAFLLAIEARGCRGRTVESYRQRLAGFTKYAEVRGLVDVVAITSTDVDGWVVTVHRQVRRWSDHPTRGVVEGGLSDATVAGRIQAVKALFAWCEERELVSRSPARHLRKPRVEQQAGDRVMSPDDLQAMVRVAEGLAVDGNPRDLALVCFLADTGCRAGELVSLRVRALDLVGCEARVNGKEGWRVVDFTAATVTVLRAWLAVRPALDHDYVFVGRQGEPLTVQGVYKVFRRLARAAGVTGRFNPHAVRHLVGQTWTDQSNLELARQKLGHRDIATTARFYANQDRRRIKEATVKFSLLSGA